MWLFFLSKGTTLLKYKPHLQKLKIYIFCVSPTKKPKSLSNQILSKVVFENEAAFVFTCFLIKYQINFFRY
jgi:hypothetical protein